MTSLMLAAVLMTVALGLATVILLILARNERRDDGPLTRLVARLEAFERSQERLERSLREELMAHRADAADQQRHLREELSGSIRVVSDGVLQQLSAMAKQQDDRLDALASRFSALTEGNEAKLEAMRTTVAERLEALQSDNGRKLDEMRQIVDEKLQGTLEQRIGESFKLVSENLERVHRGLGEMQMLASGVGDLKKVLTNVKTRGTWGEVQLGSLLEQILSPVQYEANVCTKGEGREFVEFAIKIPSKLDEGDGILWLPIDAKFPQEDYLRLVEAQDAADVQGVETAGRALENRLRGCAEDIASKYLNPPATTDFAIMFLPSEGLYAEALRRYNLSDRLQRECRVIIAGPTTLAAMLNAFQMGFRTLAIHKQSSEVWTVLGQVKTEFTKFGGVLDKIGKKLSEASKVVDDAGVRSRAIQRKLRRVEALPASGTLVGELPALAAEISGEAEVTGLGGTADGEPT